MHTFAEMNQKLTAPATTIQICKRHFKKAAWTISCYVLSDLNEAELEQNDNKTEALT